MVQLGFIGVGGMGMYQVRSFLEVRGFRITAGADLSPEARKRFAERAPGAAVYADHRELLADRNVEAVVVAVPTLFHAKMAIDVMRSGRPVMVEKPMARTVADCRRMLEVSRKTRQLLMVAHCRRYDADWGTFARVYRSGALGEPVVWRSVQSGYAPGVPWFTDDKIGGGPLFDGAVHDEDFANMLFGDPESVCASSIKLTGTTCVDTATAIVRYKTANQLVLSWSWGPAASGGGVQDVLGTKGSLLFNPPNLNGEQIDTRKYGYYRVTNLRTRKSKLVRFTRKSMYVTQGRHFLACLTGRAKCLTPGTEAIKAVAVAEAIVKVGPRGGVRRVRW